MPMMDQLLQMVKDSVMQHSQDQSHTGFDPSNLLGHIDQLFGQHASGTLGQANVRPASQDPYGDPADQVGRFGSVKPASQDPYGDPADDPRR